MARAEFFSPAQNTGTGERAGGQLTTHHADTVPSGATTNATTTTTATVTAAQVRRPSRRFAKIASLVAVPAAIAVSGLVVSRYQITYSIKTEAPDTTQGGTAALGLTFEAQNS